MGFDNAMMLGLFARKRKNVEAFKLWLFVFVSFRFAQRKICIETLEKIMKRQSAKSNRRIFLTTSLSMELRLRMKEKHSRKSSI